MTRREAMQLVAMLTSAYGGKEFPPPRAELYVELVVDLDATVAKAAVLALLKTSKFLPTIAEIRAEVAKQSLAADGIDGAEEAFSHLMHYIESSHATRLPPLTSKAAGIIGWETLRMSQRGDWRIRDRFVRVYETLLEREERMRTVEGERYLDYDNPTPITDQSVKQLATPLLEKFGMPR